MTRKANPCLQLNVTTDGPVQQVLVQALPPLAFSRFITNRIMTAAEATPKVNASISIGKGTPGSVVVVVGSVIVVVVVVVVTDAV